MAVIDKMGSDEGNERGPEPGKGAVIHDSTGEADFDGLPSDALPPKKDDERSRVAPPERSAD